MDAQIDKLLKPGDFPSFLSIENIEKRIKERKENLKAIRISIAENKAATNTAKRFSQHSDKAFYYVCLFLLVGGQLAVFGFKNWYGKTKVSKDRKPKYFRL